jgi:hypothetical protein
MFKLNGTTKRGGGRNIKGNVLIFLVVILSLYYSHRHRHTEQEEDAELLEQSKHQKAIVHFEQSPSCKL